MGMNLFYLVTIGIFTVLTIAFSYFYLKSATLRYIVKHPRVLRSLIENASKTEEEKMKAMTEDPELRSMFEDEGVQKEMNQNIANLIKEEQESKIEVRKQWQHIQNKTSEEKTGDDDIIEENNEELNDKHEDKKHKEGNINKDSENNTQQ